jgi:hypothetical protein
MLDASASRVGTALSRLEVEAKMSHARKLLAQVRLSLRDLKKLGWREGRERELTCQVSQR